MEQRNSNSPAFYPLAADNWDISELESIQQVITSNMFTMGNKVKIFESSVASKFNSRFAVMVNSGSSANLLMLAALKILLSKNKKLPENPNIIVPAVSWSTTYTPSYYLGYKLKFCDVDSNHFGLSADSTIRAIDNDTIAILAVNLLGSPSDLVRLKQLAEEKGIILLEDNCESLGASLEDKFTGTFGLMASHSSFFSHHINSMEGGWVTTNSEEIFEILVSLRAHGWTRQLPPESIFREKKLDSDWFDAQFEFVLPGFNLRPLEIEAAIASVQLSKIDKMLNVRRQNADLLIDFLKGSSNIRLQNPIGNSSWFAFALLFDSNSQRNLVANSFRQNGIECRPVVTGNFIRQPVMNYLKFEVTEDLKNADLLHDNGLYIGNHPHDLSKELDVAVSIIRMFN